jgi:hypothetical protein
MVQCLRLVASIRKIESAFHRYTSSQGANNERPGRIIHRIEMQGSIWHLPRPSGEHLTLHGQNLYPALVGVEFDSFGIPQPSVHEMMYSGVPSYNIGRLCIRANDSSAPVAPATLNISLPIEQFIAFHFMSSRQLNVTCTYCDKEDGSPSMICHTDGRETHYIMSASFEASMMSVTESIPDR